MQREMVRIGKKYFYTPLLGPSVSNLPQLRAKSRSHSYEQFFLAQLLITA